MADQTVEGAALQEHDEPVPGPVNSRELDRASDQPVRSDTRDWIMGGPDRAERQRHVPSAAWARIQLMGPDPFDRALGEVAVSYTHLDVYKRQGWESTAACSSGRRVARLITPRRGLSLIHI